MSANRSRPFRIPELLVLAVTLLGASLGFSETPENASNFIYFSCPQSPGADFAIEGFAKMNEKGETRLDLEPEGLRLKVRAGSYRKVPVDLSSASASAAGPKSLSLKLNRKGRGEREAETIELQLQDKSRMSAPEDASHASTIAFGAKRTGRHFSCYVYPGCEFLEKRKSIVAQSIEQAQLRGQMLARQIAISSVAARSSFSGGRTNDPLHKLRQLQDEVEGELRAKNHELSEIDRKNEENSCSRQAN